MSNGRISQKALNAALAEFGDIRPSVAWKHIMKELGGPAGLAREIKLDLDSLPPGAASRVRLLTAILSGLGKQDPDEGAVPPDEDIERMAREFLGEQ